ncbi:hypothetical protein LRAMOSA10748 [Lichtheimia ramosa]|uniref:Uncharacterized protein n=1 Tax=Lichtheimia ramosa TaxID=688394 RepID=A0A077WQK4_9FUNG|nr:hypothetical protein LRAMOSA10748 [Lichtheimia ramosa]
MKSAFILLFAILSFAFASIDTLPPPAPPAAEPVVLTLPAPPFNWRDALQKELGRLKLLTLAAEQELTAFGRRKQQLTWDDIYFDLRRMFPQVFEMLESRVVTEQDQSQEQQQEQDCDDRKAMMEHRRQLLWEELDPEKRQELAQWAEKAQKEQDPTKADNELAAIAWMQGSTRRVFEELSADDILDEFKVPSVWKSAYNVIINTPKQWAKRTMEKWVGCSCE